MRVRIKNGNSAGTTFNSQTLPPFNEAFIQLDGFIINKVIQNNTIRVMHVLDLVFNI